jgi:hypothetical protein
MRALPLSVPPVRRYEGAEGVSYPERLEEQHETLALVKPARKTGTK